MITEFERGVALAGPQCACRPSNVAEPSSKTDRNRSVACSVHNVTQVGKLQQMQEYYNMVRSIPMPNSARAASAYSEACTHGVTCCGRFTDCFWFI